MDTHWVKPAKNPMACGWESSEGRWKVALEASAMGAFQASVTVASTFACWLLSSLQTKQRCVVNIC